MRIRDRRHELRLDPRSVVDRLDVSRAYWSRVENDRALLSAARFREVLDLLRFDEKERPELTRLWELARSDEWFAEYGDLMDDAMRRYYGLESGASQIRKFYGSMVPGLLQSDDYARALIESFPGNRPTDFARLRRLRAQRQEQLLRAPKPPQITVVMSEAVLWQRIGGEGVLKDQIQHLLALVETHGDHLHLRIHPFDRPTSGALATAPSLVFLEFDDPGLPTIAFLEAVVSLVIIDKMREVDRLNVLYEQDLSSSLDENETRELIARRLDAMS